MQKNLIGLTLGLGLKAYAEPAVLLVVSLIISSGDGIGENEETGVGTAVFVEPIEKNLIFAIEHRQEALFRDVARAGAVNIIADGLIVSRDGLCDRPRRCSNA